jgi:putative transposase
VRVRLAERAGDQRWSSARAHLDGRDDALVRVAPLLALASDLVAFLAGGLSADEHAAIRAGERTGRSAAFTAHLERPSAAPSPAASPDPSRQMIDPAKGIQT